MFPTRSVLAGVVTAALSVAVVTPAQASPKTFDGLLALNPGLTRAELNRSLDSATRASGQTREAVIAGAVAEARQSLTAARPSTGRTVKLSGNRPLSNGGGVLNLGSAAARGDIFVSPASTLFVQHGHTGIYSETNAVVEAPGPGKKSRATSTAAYKVGSGSVKQSVGVSQSVRNAAANYAYANLRGKNYNLNFAFNRNAYGSSMNCSQLVWAAYTIVAGIDLDANGGFGVYPYNIKDSGWTTTYQTLG